MNYTSLPEEQLPISSFDLDKSARRKKLEEGKDVREKTKQMQLATIKARDKVSEYIKKSCWDTIFSKGREIHAIVAPIKVQSYSLFPESKSDINELKWITERNKTEKYFRKGDLFDAWTPRTKR